MSVTMCLCTFFWGERPRCSRDTVVGRGARINLQVPGVRLAEARQVAPGQVGSLPTRFIVDNGEEISGTAPAAGKTPSSSAWADWFDPWSGNQDLTCCVVRLPSPPKATILR